jgi:hypothetical protein
MLRASASQLLDPLDPQDRSVLDRDHPDLGAGRAIVALDPPRTVADPNTAVAMNDRLFEKEIRPFRLKRATRKTPLSPSSIGN